MPSIPVVLEARAHARRFVAAMGVCTLAFAGLGLQAAPAAAHAGRVLAFGAAEHLGAPTEALAGIATIPPGTGYWTLTPGGVVRAFGAAPALGSANRAGAVDIAAALTGRGYWVAFADGGVKAFGDADFHGSMAGKRLNSPIVGIAPTRSGAGYWLVASDGGVFSFGDARYMGGMGGTRLVAPVTAIATTATGQGYWMAAEDGGVFSFGDAGFRGSLSVGNITSMASAPRGLGYWLVARDGSVFSFGTAPHHGDDAAIGINDIAARPQGDGYWLATGDVPPPPAPAPTGYRAAAGDPPDSDFDRLAQCESSGNWAARGSYEGGLQFMNSTWLGYGGGEFAQHAYDASREQQIEIGRRLWRERGWSPWPHCSQATGLA